MIRISLAALLLAATPAFAQAPAEAPIADRYARAAKLLLVPATTGVRNESVIPHWIGGQDRFWYLRQAEKGAAFVVVDAATGASSPAFDAPAIAESLALLLKTKVSVDALPFQSFDYSPDGSRIALAVGPAKFTCVVATSVCTADAPSRIEPYMTPSPDGRTAVFQRDGNLWLRDIATGTERALTSDGVPEKGWGVAAEPSDFHALRRQDAGGKRPPFWTIWSPDSRRLITTFVDQSHVQPYPFMDYAPTDGSIRPKVRTVRLPLIGERPPTIQFYALDVATGVRTRIDLDGTKLETIELAAHHGEWAPDGRHRIAAEQRKAGHDRRQPVGYRRRDRRGA